MRIYTKLVFDMSDGSLLESESFDYEGEVALCKGDNTAKQGEQQSVANQQQDSQYQQQLMNIFQQQFGQQQQVLNFLNGKMQATINNPQGYDQATLNAMRTSADDQLSGQYQNAQKALNAQMFASGGRDLPSGVDSQLNASLLNSEATDKANAQNSITVQNANLAQQNYWNAVSVDNGVAAQYNPQSYAGEATNMGNAASGAGNATANLSNAYSNSQNAGFFNHFANSFGSALGAGLGGGLSGGMGTAASTLGSGNFGW